MHDGPYHCLVLPRMYQPCPYAHQLQVSSGQGPLLRYCQTLTERSFAVLALSATMDSIKRNSQPRPQNERLRFRHGKKIQGTIHTSIRPLSPSP